MLVVLRRLNEQYLSSTDADAQTMTTPIKTIWEAERVKLELLRDGIKAGAKPGLMPVLKTIGDAAADWQQLSAVANTAAQEAARTTVVELRPHARAS